MSDFIGKLEFDTEAHPGARIIPLDNGRVIVPDPDFDPWATVGTAPWSPFDADGNLRDLEAEGWHRMGAIRDGAS
ncbi:hypothetical protein [Mycolicibacterium llatzerense]|uniref:hypothetical protein n=1 Tax=Mycolicibacterium llatzerense TaxID=280871 RepID=UPI0021B67BD2|nr:hypothetical protein [Mycolicibacterium llatzerense]MCT7373191.1 hypothetical protein [Mycolicibacterium llatzerense]